MSTILITGATGLIGKQIVSALTQRGDRVIAVTRNSINAKKALPQINEFLSWNDLTLHSELRIDTIINLAGTNLGAKRWNNKFKQELYDSRINATNNIVELIKKMKYKPQVLVNASGIDYYGDTGDKEIDESAPCGTSFIARLVNDWENAALKAQSYGVRVVLIRTGFVFARKSKALAKMIFSFKLFAGGYAGSGKQFLSWIDIADIVNVFMFCIDNHSISGPVNAVSPYPKTMKKIAGDIGKIMIRPSFLRAPGFLIKLLFGESSELILSGRKAIPKKLTENGFKLKYEHAVDSLKKALSVQK